MRAEIISDFGVEYSVPKFAGDSIALLSIFIVMLHVIRFHHFEVGSFVWAYVMQRVVCHLV